MGDLLLMRLSPGGSVIAYEIGTSRQELVFSDLVLQHFRHHRQLRFWQPEAGGQLFARFQEGIVVVEEATGPRPTDRRTRSSYHPDRRAEQAEIRDRHARGLHFVGDWHTHPERIPRPSRRDIDSMADCFTKSGHSLNGFVLVTVGQADPTSILHVSLHDGKGSYELVTQP